MPTYKEGYSPKPNRRNSGDTEAPKLTNSAPPEIRNTRVNAAVESGRSGALSDMAASSNRTKDMITDFAEPLPVGRQKTGGGDYPVYKKGSSNAQSFNDAFGAAKKAGMKEFDWQGRKYATKSK